MFEVLSNMLGLPTPPSYTAMIKQPSGPDSYFEEAKKEVLANPPEFVR